MFIDTHCHLSKEYYNDIDLIVYQNKESGTDKMIISGCDSKGIEEALEYIKRYDLVYATIGYHPEEAEKVTDQDLINLEDRIKSNPKVIGLGEIGLDYHYNQSNQNLQKELFEKQLIIAEKLNIPVVIHSRDATKDTIDMLKKYPVKGIIHCFSGSVETAREYIAMNYKLGIGGVVTFKNSKLHQVIEKIPLENIVLETDSPYLTPSPYRGKINSSKYIPFIALEIAKIKKINEDLVYQITNQNCSELFDFNL